MDMPMNDMQKNILDKLKKAAIDLREISLIELAPEEDLKQLKQNELNAVIMAFTQEHPSYRALYFTHDLNSKIDVPLYQILVLSECEYEPEDERCFSIIEEDGDIYYTDKNGVEIDDGDELYDDRYGCYREVFLNESNELYYSVIGDDGESIIHIVTIDDLKHLKVPSDRYKYLRIKKGNEAKKARKIRSNIKYKKSLK